jgi:hypothetical protein
MINHVADTVARLHQPWAMQDLDMSSHPMTRTGVELQPAWVAGLASAEARLAPTLRRWVLRTWVSCWVGWSVAMLVVLAR